MAIRWRREATRTETPATSSTVACAQSSARGIGSVANRSTSRHGLSGSYSEKTCRLRCSTQDRRVASSANSRTSTGSRGNSPSPDRAVTAAVAGPTARSTTRSRSTVIRACPCTTTAVPPTTTKRTPASVRATYTSS